MGGRRGRQQGRRQRPRATLASLGNICRDKKRQPLIKHMNLLTVRFFRRLVKSLPTQHVRSERLAIKAQRGWSVFCSNANDSSDDGSVPSNNELTVLVAESIGADTDPVVPRPEHAQRSGAGRSSPPGPSLPLVVPLPHPFVFCLYNTSKSDQHHFRLSLRLTGNEGHV